MQLFAHISNNVLMPLLKLNILVAFKIGQGPLYYAPGRCLLELDVRMHGGASWSAPVLGLCSGSWHMGLGCLTFNGVPRLPMARVVPSTTRDSGSRWVLPPCWAGCFDDKSRMIAPCRALNYAAQQ